MGRFTLPRDVYHGRGTLSALKDLKGKRAMICVGGSTMKKFGFLDKAIAYLREAGMEVEVFGGIEPDPSVETVMRGAEAMLKFEPDWIVAMGGGSPIDAAKAMWIKYEYPEITLSLRKMKTAEFRELFPTARPSRTIRVGVRDFRRLGEMWQRCVPTSTIWLTATRIFFPRCSAL